MTAYIIANNNVTEYEGQLAAYRGKVTETAQSFGGRYLARGTPIKVLEGQWLKRQRNVISAWPDQAAAERFWFSDAYQKDIRPKRIGTSVNDIGLFAGDSAPPATLTDHVFMLVLAQIVHMPATMAEYGKRAAEIATKFGGVYLSRGNRLKVLEGEWFDRTRVMLMMWPSLKVATDFWTSPEYQAVKPLRDGSGVYDIALFAAEKH